MTSGKPKEDNSTKKKKKASIFNVGCGASLLMIFYMGTSFFNLYRLMNPLVAIGDLSIYPPDNFVGSLWKSTSKLYVRVYLSSQQQFSRDFLYDNDDISVMLLESEFHGSLSKSFLLCNGECNDDDSSTSYSYANQWLDDAEKKLDGGVLSSLKAGEGIESTSVLLVMWDTITQQLGNLMRLMGLTSSSENNNSAEESSSVSDDDDDVKRSNIELSAKMFSRLHSNSTLFVHVLITQTPLNEGDDPLQVLSKASRSNSLLIDQVNLIKYEKPHHIEKPKRILLDDVKYMIGLAGNVAPWDLEQSQPEDFAIYQSAEQMKANNEGYPYWKPEVSIKYIQDETKYPKDYVHMSGMRLVNTEQTKDHPTGIAMLPSLHVDEIGLTSDKYLPVNTTLTAIPLRISMDRSDVESEEGSKTGNTATAGGMSPARWRLLSQMSDSLESQKKLGFEQSDIDDLRRLIADTNVTLLLITILASGLHLLFEFLTFKNEVSFWQANKDLTGLSVRSLFLDMIGQFVILLFLIEKESSLLVTIPCLGGCLVALWKCQRGAGFQFLKLNSAAGYPKGNIEWYNKLFRIFGYELRAVRLESAKRENSKTITKDGKKKLNMAALSEETDRYATKTLGAILLPFVLGYTLYSLCFEKHIGWYSWLITSASSAVYALGFALMTPQLFLNYKLKSVAHLPWRVLVYKFLNTFIDDLFAFIIRMPTQARIACFRDDIVFIIYLYQRWQYPVDTSRPVEGGDGSSSSAAVGNDDEKKKKE
eukprot:CAMPEP_0194138966 /NCGR_PEP_ID=MMETSP0152-20130528/8715_1 /TAXON_ID=1049557 /ORGANISM="Thalassiothrix antarctica, Strain L6-D1" /LENGTH=759 /DNA_ID=CAMNT_0038836649 /DNA_START=51 /DNA_END=2330 /DNA_ORIENTATION=+